MTEAQEQKQSRLAALRNALEQGSLRHGHRLINSLHPAEIASLTARDAVVEGGGFALGAARLKAALSLQLRVDDSQMRFELALADGRAEGLRLEAAPAASAPALPTP